MRFIFATAFLLLTIACGFSFAAEPTPTPTATATSTPRPSPTSRTPQPTPAPISKLVSVGNYKLYIECTGSRGPTVVMDAGLSASGRLWYLVAPKVAAFTRVCTYDRANTGRSERAPTPRTSQDVVNDLHSLLGNAGVQPPYVLVGHSLGGLNMRLYANEFRSEVVGLVLVDAAHEDEWERFGALLPPEFPGEPLQLKDFRRQFNNPVQGIEKIDLKISGDQLKAKRQSYGDMPLMVISHGKPVADVPAVFSPIVEGVWTDMQKDLLKWSRNSKQIIATESDHGIPTEQPQLIVDAIREEVNAAR
ncbi:MAG: alpha/beta hydrolase [Chloroflexi bacterium]|nr:alpha/beta hydrolase [Chloroflexota bacterium]